MNEIANTLARIFAQWQLDNEIANTLARIFAQWQLDNHLDTEQHIVVKCIVVKTHNNDLS